MTAADAIPQRKVRRKSRSYLWLPYALLVGVILGGAVFVWEVLLPTWPSKPAAVGAPTMPITVVGVLFDVPPGAVRVPVQRQPGPHDRVDLVFLWPSLTPPQGSGKESDQAIAKLESGDDEVPAVASDRLFVTIAGLGKVLPPLERLRSIYPRYVETQASAGADGLAILPFRNGTPYEGEDIVYFAAKPEQFFARCTRPLRLVPGTCIHERALDAAEVTFRFPRDWLGDWRNVAAGFDRLMAQLHPQKN